jgi:hypothetical protein
MNFASISASKHKLPPGRRGATIMKANRGQITGLGMSWLLSLLVTIAGAKALPAGQALMPIVNGASAREQILAMNEELESLARASTKQTQPSERARIGTLLQLRAGLLEQIIRRDPAGAIELGLPSAARENLAKQAVEAGGALESRGEWEGRLEVVVEDDFQNQRSRTLYYLSGTDGVLEVYFAAGVPPPGTSRPIHVSGMRLGQLLAASQWRSVDTLSAAACSTTGEQRVAVLLVSFPSQPLLSAVTAEMLHQTYFGSGLSLDGFLRESSYGKTWATGQVFGPFVLDADFFGQPAAVRDAAVRVASPSVDLKVFNRIVLVVPQASTGLTSGGLGTIGCSEIPLGPSGSLVASTAWLGDATLGSESERVGTASHEMGHNLGLEHARAADFGGEPLGPVGELPAPWDQVHDYGDSFSNMGRNLEHWAAPHKLLLGWLQNGTTVQTVEASGSLVLQPYEDGASGVKALRIRRGTGNDAWLWLENRQPLGTYDSTLPSSAFTGAMVHYEDSAWRDTEAHTNLLRFAADDPRGLFFGNAPLAAGSRWTDPYSNLTITADRAVNGGLAVGVTFAAAPVCPTSLNPGRLSVAPEGGTAGIDVAAPGNCSWTATSSVPWITITSGAAGTGSGRLTISVPASPVIADRWGRIVVGQTTAVVIQTGVAGNASVSPLAATFPAAGGVGELSVSTNAPDYAWSFASNAPWIQSLFCSKYSSVGPANLRYIVAQNTNPQSRTGTISVGAQTVSVKQAGGGPAVSQLVWQQVDLPDAPISRLCMAMASFPGRQQAVLYGGGSFGTTLTDTWVWDGSRWAQSFPAHNPGPRCDHAMAYDAARGQVLLFGGFDASSQLSNETWTWDGVDWVQLHPQDNPPARYAHAMASDPGSKKIVLFGGADYLGDTWEWDGSNWTERVVATAPPHRYYHAMAYDAARKVVVMFGGASDLYNASIAPTFFSDTWVWDGSVWEQKPTAVSPSPRRGHQMEYDPELGQVILVGGAGGLDVQTSPPYSYGIEMREETWCWNGTSWAQKFPDKSPEFSYTYGLIWDSAHHAFTAHLGDDLHCAARGPKTYVLTAGPGAILLDRYRAEFPASGGQGSVAVTTSAPWTARSGDSWITITAGGESTGSGTLAYAVAANAGSARTGTVWIGGQPQVVWQADGGGGLQAAFTCSPPNSTTGVAVTFTDTSTGSPTSWSWDFGDGTTSTSQSPTHVYQAVGRYTVSLIVSKGSATSKASRTMSVLGHLRRHL